MTAAGSSSQVKFWLLGQELLDCKLLPLQENGCNSFCYRCKNCIKEQEESLGKFLTQEGSENLETDGMQRGSDDFKQKQEEL